VGAVGADVWAVWLQRRSSNEENQGWEAADGWIWMLLPPKLRVVGGLSVSSSKSLDSPFSCVFVALKLTGEVAKWADLCRPGL
jgi:hypothetical protein